MNADVTQVCETENSFIFSEENLTRAQKIISRYPVGKQASAVMALLDLAQRQGGWLSKSAINYVATLLEMPPIRVYEVASFYTMYIQKPGGKHRINICTTTPCWLRGSDEIVESCERKLNIKLGETSADNQFTLNEVECLGACVNAPVVQIDDDYFEDLDASKVEGIIDALSRGERPSLGSQTGRQGACPANGPTTLQNQVVNNKPAEDN